MIGHLYVGFPPRQISCHRANGFLSTISNLLIPNLFQHDLHRKPQGIISLHESCRVSSAEGSNTFEIATSGKMYYLTADSQPLVEEWVRVLQNVVQRNALRLLLSRQDQAPTLQGWLVKVKHGHSRRVWCVLLGKMFVYFRSPNEQNPLGQLNMRDSRVEEVKNSTLCSP